MTRIKETEAILILENIRSTHNVGAIFRTADAAGCSKIYLIGYTPLPVDRFGKPRKDVAKAALGAELTVPWEYRKTIAPIVNTLKKEGYTILSLEQDARSVPHHRIKVRKFALIVGNEVDGVSTYTLSKSDNIIEIPMKGSKESLNVSVATGIALFRLLE